MRPGVASEARRFNDGWVEVRGEARERAQSVLTVLRTRGLSIDDRARARALAAHDLEALARWLVLAITAPTGEAFTAAMA
jgi:hypothetical protein